MRNHTSIVLILDESGSMHSVCDKTIEGVNSFINDQKRLGSNADLTLILFATEIVPLCTAKPIDEVASISDKEYIPSGGWSSNR